MAKSKKKVKKQFSSGNEIWGVIIALIGILLLISLLVKTESVFKTYIADGFMRGTFGIGAYAIPVLLVAAGIMLIMLKKPKMDYLKIFMTVLMALSVVGLIHMCFSMFVPVGTSRTVHDFSSAVEQAYEQGISNLGLGGFAALYVYPLTALVSDIGAFCVFIALIVILLALAVVALLIFGGFRATRIMVWLNPEQYSSKGGFQVLQGLYAIGSGGLFGKGLGKSIQKLGFVPEAQNDMILSIICEELGVFGIIIMLTLFGMLLYRLMFITFYNKSLGKKNRT